MTARKRVTITAGMQNGHPQSAFCDKKMTAPSKTPALPYECSQQPHFLPCSARTISSFTSLLLEPELPWVERNYPCFCFHSTSLSQLRCHPTVNGELSHLEPLHRTPLRCTLQLDTKWLPCTRVNATVELSAREHRSKARLRLLEVSF